MLLFTVRRLSLAVCLSAACVGGVEAQVDQSQPSEKFAKHLAIQAEIQRELLELQPMLLHLGLQILQELRELERRPEASPGAWAEAIRRRHTFDGGRLRATPIDVVLRGVGPPESLSADEKIVWSGGVQRLLIHLAITGRVSEREFNSFVQRLHGN